MPESAPESGVEKAVTIIGSPSCTRETERVVRLAVGELRSAYGISIKVNRMRPDSAEADRFQPIVEPTIVIDDRIVWTSRIPSKAEAKKMIEKALKCYG